MANEIAALCFNAADWMASHRDFVAWWKNHRYSGFCEIDGKWRWGIPPWQAYGDERYRAEYSGKSRHYSDEEIRNMRAESASADCIPPEFMADTRQEGQLIIKFCLEYMAGRRSITLNGKEVDATSAEEYIFAKVRASK